MKINSILCDVWGSLSLPSSVHALAQGMQKENKEIHGSGFNLPKLNPPGRYKNMWKKPHAACILETGDVTLFSAW